MFKFLRKKLAQELEKPPTQERLARELLRENLDTLVVDMFYGDDPIVLLGPEDREQYLRKFYDIMNDKDIIGRIMYLANKQANLTLKSMKDMDGLSDMAGSMNINGICVVKDDFERLGNKYKKERKEEEKFNRFEII